MEEVHNLPGVHAFEKRLKFGRLEIEIIAGLVYGIGLAITIEKSFFYYGLFIFKLMVPFLFLEISTFWGETPLEE